ncbi:MAG: hypothetical protein WD021_01580 [Rhodothermales bacterium]
MFELMFKFSRINFSEGTLALQSGTAAWLFAAAVVVLAVGLVLIYRSTERYASRRDRAISFSLRSLVLLLLCLPLLEPILVMPDVVPDENFVAVLVDASQSMNVPDGRDGITRSEEAASILYDGTGAVLPDLEEVFKVRAYAFGDDAHRVDSIGSVPADRHGTNLSTALNRVLADFRGLPLAGVVLLTDGADNSTDVPLNSAEALRERDVPLHVIGLGSGESAGERELLEALVSRGVEETTGAEIDVKIRSWREEPEPVSVDLYEGDELVHTERYALKGDGRIDQYTFSYEPEGTGAREYSIRLEAAVDERNVENNSTTVLIDPRQDTLRVLYIEGHPRREFKFVKRALDDDTVVQFTSILRTGSGKFYRQGIRHPDELAGGFPTSEEELFGFHAVLFGDVEASHFTLEQLSMIERFVRLRGGGFGMLGGRLSFAEGAYWDNPIADLLPVALDPSRSTVIPPVFGEEGAPPEEQGFAVVPTAAGLESPILRLSVDPVRNRRQWTEMPGLTSINYLGAVKPGASVLAEKPDDEFGASEPVLVVQRYGKGRSAALATASTWRWQMLLEADDQRHERFWRQFVRWLAASAPDRVDVDLGNDRFAPGEEIDVTVQVFDDRYLPVTDAAVGGTFTDPLGAEADVEFRPDLGMAGSYSATLLPSVEGVYTLDSWAVAGGDSLPARRTSMLVRPSGKEYFDAVLKRSSLEQLADVAGGVYYEPEDTGMLASNLRNRRTSTSVYTVEYLWDMPFLFGLALVLLSVEWIWRRRKGLP